jgi:GNAT superfamily N-acetyltransferase
MEFQRCGYAESDLKEYATLFAVCFPDAKKLADVAYLRWLYAENPCGAVVGYNARHEGRLVAHYVCVPMSVTSEGQIRSALLSLNTATHPEFQGKGLFTRLAELTYAAGAEEGAELIYGVANGNSTPGFVRKLGFSLVAPLESRVGVGRLGDFDWSQLRFFSRFQQAWTMEALSWRMRNPVAPVSCHRRGKDAFCVSTSAGRIGFRAWAELPTIGDVAPEPSVAATVSLRVWLGLLPAGLGKFAFFPNIPQRLRPSPLNLIVRGLQSPLVLSPEEVFFNFLDFDAF